MWTILKLRLLKLRESYLIIVVMTAMSLVLTFAFGGMSGNTTYKPDLVIVNDSSHELSQIFLEDLEALKYYNLNILTKSEAEDAVGSNDYFAGVIIDKSFGENVEDLDDNLSIIALKDDAEIMTLKGNLASIISKMNQKETLVSIGSAVFAQIPGVNVSEMSDNIRTSYEKQWLYRKPMTIETSVSGTDSKSSNTKGLILGFAIMFSAYTMVFGIGDILIDKQERTWHRMMVSPLKKYQILFGYSIVTIFVGVLQLGIIFFAGQYLFSVDWDGQLVGMFISLLAYVFALTCLGLLLSTFVKTPSQLSAFTPIILTSFAMLGGCLWPLEVVTSDVLLLLSNITPHKWAMQALTNLTIKGLPLSSSIFNISVLVMMGLVAFCLSVYRLRDDVS